MDLNDLRQELNLIALSENMCIHDVVQLVLEDFIEDYWTEQKRKPKAVGFIGGKSE